MKNIILNNIEKNQITSHKSQKINLNKITSNKIKQKN